MTNKKHLVNLVLLVCLVSIDCLAQEGHYRHDDATQLWRLTDNAAGLSLDSSRNRGVAYFDVQHWQGDYSRVQEGNKNNTLTFYTERYQSISPILVGYGSFRFDMGRTKNRSWCDVMRPYNSNPYYGGSSVKGSYDLQTFDFTAAVGTVQWKGLTGGMRIDYKTGDLSRIRDPRSRARLLDYRITPSLTYSTGQHTIGLSGNYNRRKETMPVLTTVQNDPNLMYYDIWGMEHVTGSVGAYNSFSREWVEHAFGTALSYNYRDHQVNSLTTIGISHGKEYIYEKEKHEPGRYNTYHYTASTRNRIASGNIVHQLDLSATWTQAYGDEYRQQRIQTTNAETGISSYHWETQIEYKKRYRVHQLEADLHYRATFNSGSSQNAYAGIRLGVNDVKNEHHLPTSSLEYDHFDATLEGGAALLRDKSLWIDASAGYHLSAKDELTLSNPESDYAQQVLVPDMLYYGADYWQGRLQVTWQLPITISSGSTCFVRAYGDYLKTNNSLYRSTIGASIGIYY